MAVDMFLEISTIKGESEDSVFKAKGAMDVLAWSWGMSNSGNAHIGGGAGAGVVSVQDFSCTKWMDKASPILMMGVTNGTHYAKAILSVRKAGDNPMVYYRVTMEDVLITSLSSGGSGGEDRFTENLSLNFAKFNVDYITQGVKGAGDITVPMGYDIKGKAKV